MGSQPATSTVVLERIRRPVLAQPQLQEHPPVDPAIFSELQSSIASALNVVQTSVDGLDISVGERREFDEAMARARSSKLQMDQLIESGGTEVAVLKNAADALSDMVNGLPIDEFGHEFQRTLDSSCAALCFKITRSISKFSSVSMRASFTLNRFYRRELSQQEARQQLMDISENKLPELCRHYCQAMQMIQEAEPLLQAHERLTDEHQSAKQRYVQSQKITEAELCSMILPLPASGLIFLGGQIVGYDVDFGTINGASVLLGLVALSVLFLARQWESSVAKGELNACQSRLDLSNTQLSNLSHIR